MCWSKYILVDSMKTVINNSNFITDDVNISTWLMSKFSWEKHSLYSFLLIYPSSSHHDEVFLILCCPAEFVYWFVCCGLCQSIIMLCVHFFCCLYHVWLCVFPTSFQFDYLFIIAYFGKFIYNFTLLVIWLLFVSFPYLVSEGFLKGYADPWSSIIMLHYYGLIL